MLPRGVEEYLERREASLAAATAEARGSDSAGAVQARGPDSSPAQQREARKTVARVEKQLARLTERESALHAEMVEHASDYERLAAVDVRLREVAAEKQALEDEWLAAADLME
jgi:ATP-binding cassette subfamily F protein uup